MPEPILFVPSVTEAVLSIPSPIMISSDSIVASAVMTEPLMSLKLMMTTFLSLSFTLMCIWPCSGYSGTKVGETAAGALT